MTNRRDIIDEALRRLGRLEVQMEIGLPDEHGRGEMLKINTTLMREHEKLNTDVNVPELALQIKNFSGAEIECLVRVAQSQAMNRLIKATDKVEVVTDALTKLNITRADFGTAFGTASDILQRVVTNGIG